jgi:hypothetical protein
MKRQFMVLLLAIPVCMVAGGWAAATSSRGAASFSLSGQAWAMLLGLYHSVAQLPEAGTLLVLGAGCFILAWLLHRRWNKTQA